MTDNETRLEHKARRTAWYDSMVNRRMAIRIAAVALTAKVIGPTVNEVRGNLLSWVEGSEEQELIPWSYQVKESDVEYADGTRVDNPLWNITEKLYPQDEENGLPPYEIIPFYTLNIVNETAENDPGRKEANEANRTTLTDIRSGDILIITGPEPANGDDVYQEPTPEDE